MNLKEDIFYFSGYTDGDGCFFISPPSKKSRYTFHITSTNSEIIKYLVATYGGSIYCNQNKNRRTNAPCFYYTIHGESAYKFCKKLSLYEKHNQLRLFLDFFKYKSKKRKKDIYEEFKRSRNQGFCTLDDISKLKLITKSVTTCKEGFIYLAGFIDAECHLGIQHYKPKNRPNEVYKIVIQCNNTKSMIFYWLKHRFGGSCHFKYKKSKNINWNNQILWKLSGKDCYVLVKNVLPFLRHKKNVAEKIIEFYDTTMTNGGDRQSKFFKKTYESILAKRQNIVSQVHNLNQHGL